MAAPTPFPPAAREAILAWYANSGRDLPFRRTTDPYAILVSEAMAQQTQAARAAASWTAFMARFPTVAVLAAATPGDVLRAWQGLGYNRRAVNLWRAAGRVVESFGGEVPRDLTALESLPGVGPYTARAVAAIAFGMPVGAVDTNVRRVLGRIVAGADDALAPAELQRLADTAVPGDRPAAWTHAVMDLGAGPCRPRRPDCGACPARAWCRYAMDRAVDADLAAVPATARPSRATPASLATREAAAPFRMTSRWLRGRIIDRLREQPIGRWASFDGSIGDHDAVAVSVALLALAREGLLELDPGAAPRLRARLPDTRYVVNGYASGAMTPSARPDTTDAAPPLPADDPSIFAMDLRGLRRHWAVQAALPAISAETMTGADRRAQALGYPESRLMEHAGTAVAAAVRALATDLGRWGSGPIVVLCGPGNNGGDGFVAARRLALAGASVIVAVVASEARPRGATSARNWERVAGDAGIVKVHLPVARDVAMFANGVEKAAVVVDALLGTGVQGALREPIRSAVEVIGRARAAGVPVVAVDTPTAVDLSSGEPSDPAVIADLTITFHRPKTGLLTRRGAAHAGRILVAPIGIPPGADRG